MKSKSKPTPAVDYQKIAQSQSFRELMASKKKFIVPITVFFLLFYFVLPVLTAYTDVLNKEAFGSISWGWLLAFSQFIMTWVLCSVYSRKAKVFDEQIKEIASEAGKKEVKGA